MNSESRTRRLVCLTGFMGCGKSTTAALLARQIGWAVVDLDIKIEEATSLTIPEIFTRFGEPEFRKMESDQLIRSVNEFSSLDKPCIFSLGGGTLTLPRNVAFLREHRATIIWLECPVESLLFRCAQVTNRPLFRDEASFRKLYEERLSSYALADYRVNGNVEPPKVVEQILGLGIFPEVAA